MTEVPLPLKKGEAGTVTSLSKKNPGYLTIDRGIDIWHWTLFELV